MKKNFFLLALCCVVWISNADSAVLMESASFEKQACDLPVIDVQPRHANVCSGQMAKFSVVVSSADAVSYQWKRDDIPLEGEINQTLEFIADITDDALYSVDITNSCGTITSSKRFISVTPVFTYSSVSVIQNSPTPGQSAVCKGTEFSFSAIPDMQEELSYQWYVNDVPIEHTASFGYVPNNEDQVRVVINGYGKCSNGPISSGVKVIHVVPSAVTIFSSTSMVIDACGTVWVTAYPISASGQNYTWKRNGEIAQGPDIVGTFNRAAAAGDVITCELTSRTDCPGVSTVSNELIAVAGIPTIVSLGFTNTGTLYERETIGIDATVTGGGQPEHDVFWYVNGSEVSPDSKHHISSNTFETGDVISVVVRTDRICHDIIGTFSITIPSLSLNPVFSSFIDGPTSVAENQKGVTYSVPFKQGMKYEWTVSSGITIVSGQGTNSVVVDFSTVSGTNMRIVQGTDIQLKETNPALETSTIRLEGTTGIAERRLASSIQVYPVPAQHACYIQFTGSLHAPIQYFIIDSRGIKISTGKIYSNDPIEFGAALNAGMYYVQFHSDEAMITKKVLKE